MVSLLSSILADRKSNESYLLLAEFVCTFLSRVKEIYSRLARACNLSMLGVDRPHRHIPQKAAKHGS